jgi:hypothetical protein
MAHSVNLGSLFLEFFEDRCGVHSGGVVCERRELGPREFGVALDHAQSQAQSMCRFRAPTSSRRHNSAGNRGHSGPHLLAQAGRFTSVMCRSLPAARLLRSVAGALYRDWSYDVIDKAVLQFPAHPCKGGSGSTSSNCYTYNRLAHFCMDYVVSWLISSPSLLSHIGVAWVSCI